MASLARVRAGGRSLDRRLASVPPEALLAGLRAAGAVSEPEVAALGAPASGGWAGRLRALAVARGDRTCGVLLSVLRRLEGPPRPGPFDFYDPQRDAAPAHRSDCPCCRPEPEWTRQEEEEGPAKIGDEGHEEEDGGGGDEGHEEEEDGGGGDEGHEEEEEEEEENPKNEDEEGHEEDDGGGGDEGHEEEEEEPKNGDEGHEDDDDDGGDDEGHEDDDDDGGDDDGADDDGGGGDEGHDDDDGGGGDED